MGGGGGLNFHANLIRRNLKKFKKSNLRFLGAHVLQLQFWSFVL